jgi:hypothetical protein
LPLRSLKDVCSLILLPLSATGAVDTGSKAATGTANTAGKPATGITDTSDKPATGINNTNCNSGKI